MYVGMLHALPQLVALVRTGQWAPPRPRDDPRTIRSRLGCASLATLVNMMWTCKILAKQGFLSKRQPFRFLDALAWLGLPMPRLSFLMSHWLPFHPSLSATFLEGLRIVGRAALLTSFLYLGTFWADLRANALPGQAGYYDEKGPRPGLLFWRNYVTVRDIHSQLGPHDRRAGLSLVHGRHHVGPLPNDDTYEDHATGASILWSCSPAPCH